MVTVKKKRKSNCNMNEKEVSTMINKWQFIAKPLQFDLFVLLSLQIDLLLLYSTTILIPSSLFILQFESFFTAITTIGSLPQKLSIVFL
jgi:hypothetical protein